MATFPRYPRAPPERTAGAAQEDWGGAHARRGGRAPVASAASTAAAGAAAHAPYGAEQPPGGVSGNGAQTQLPAYTTHYRDYAVLGGFSMTGSRSGKFVAPEMSGEKYFEAKGIPKHRDERQMGHYFDFNEWQEQMNARKAMQGRGGGATGSKRLRGGKNDHHRRRGGWCRRSFPQHDASVRVGSASVR